jgi:hypothetical protein
MSEQPEHQAWLVRAASIRLLWRLFAGVLVFTLLAQFVIKVKGYFVIDGWPAFAAVFGFIACLLMVLVAKALGVVLKRDQEYYRAGESDD